MLILMICQYHTNIQMVKNFKYFVRYVNDVDDNVNSLSLYVTKSQGS